MANEAGGQPRRYEKYGTVWGRVSGQADKIIQAKKLAGTCKLGTLFIGNKGISTSSNNTPICNN